MRAHRVITGAALLLIAVAGCGQAGNQTAPVGQPVPTAPSSTDPSTPGSPDPSTPPPTSGMPQGAAVPVPDSQVDTGALPNYYKERKVWILNGGRTLQLSAMAQDACTGVTAIVTEQNQTEVRVMIKPMDVPQGGSPDGPPVDLKVPLGDRKVIVTEAP